MQELPSDEIIEFEGNFEDERIFLTVRGAFKERSRRLRQISREAFVSKLRESD